MKLVVDQRAIGTARKTVKEIIRRIGLARMAFGVELATQMTDRAAEIIKKETNKSGKKKASGKVGLANSITPIVIIKRPYLTRIHVTAAAPYAPWIEWGSGTPVGLPYSNVSSAEYNRDYSNSSYRGIKYMTRSAKYYTTPIRIQEIFKPILIKSISGI